MRNRSACPTLRPRLLASAILALGLAAAAAPLSAHAQTGVAPTTPQPPAAPQPAVAPAPDPGSLGGVTVEGARRDPLRNMDPKKRAEFDREAAKQAGWQHYRTSMPPLAADSKGISYPNDLSVDYPGLNTLLPAK